MQTDLASAPGKNSYPEDCLFGSLQEQERSWHLIVESVADAEIASSIGFEVSMLPDAVEPQLVMQEFSHLKGRKVALVAGDRFSRCGCKLEICTGLFCHSSDLRILSLSDMIKYKIKTISDWYAWTDEDNPADQVSEIAELIEKSPRWVEIMGWPRLFQIPSDTQVRNDFPIKDFPGWVRDMAKTVSISTQTPTALAATMALATLAVSNQGRCYVDVRNGWFEPLCLYTAVVLPPGTRKSSVFRLMTEPLSRYEAEEKARLKPAVQELAIKKKILEKKLQNAEKDLTRGGEKAEERVFSLRLELSELGVIRAPRILSADITPEGAALKMAKNKGRLGIFSTEGAEFFEMSAGRYSARGQYNLNFLLKVHSGDPVKVDRADPSKASIDIPFPTLSMSLCLQPIAFNKAWEDNVFRGRGLLDRFLFARPANPLGSRSSNAPSLDLEIARNYSDKITQMLRRNTASENMSIRIGLDMEATEALHRLMDSVEPELGPGGKLESISGWGGKFVGAVLRIAGLLHLAMNEDRDYSENISLDTLEHAISIGEFFLNEALCERESVTLSPDEILASNILARICKYSICSFYERDMYRALGCKAEELRKAVALLKEADCVRELESNNGVRHANKLLAVNPYVHLHQVKSVRSVRRV